MICSNNKPRRVVPLGQYVRRQSQKAMLSSLGGAGLMAGGLGIGLCVAFVIIKMATVGGYDDTNKALEAMLLTCAGCGLSLGLSWRGYVAVTRAARLEKVEPLTRYNSNRLPAQESLVRGAQEPTEGLQSTLLHPVRHAPDGDKEWLLRPEIPERVITLQQ